jgi:hypothetical protein
LKKVAVDVFTVEQPLGIHPKKYLVAAKEIRNPHVSKEVEV